MKHPFVPHLYNLIILAALFDAGTVHAAVKLEAVTSHSSSSSSAAPKTNVGATAAAGKQQKAERYDDEIVTPDVAQAQAVEKRKKGYELLGIITRDPDLYAVRNDWRERLKTALLNGQYEILVDAYQNPYLKRKRMMLDFNDHNDVKVYVAHSNYTILTEVLSEIALQQQRYVQPQSQQKNNQKKPQFTQSSVQNLRWRAAYNSVMNGHHAQTAPAAAAASAAHSAAAGCAQSSSSSSSSSGTS